ncbi:hypothetical protein P3T76_009319 [Phytophthora citrophthora]|uniref:Uncharacterized protein n=1 Tax=Phytophthora citrophthora TaxID=4793 RepID=A0AAD9LJZ2_9STRA|nr:hypothetical protein P3T76_009319 [Phytophthora citrophthora]
MPDAEFPDNEKVQEFLRGPEASMTNAATEGRDKFVTITKTRNWFLACQKELVEYKMELQFCEGSIRTG